MAEEKKEEKLDLSKKLTIDKVNALETGFAIGKEGKPTKGKRVFMRCDFNVPLDDNQNITDVTRITATLPTINKLLSMNPDRIVLCSHLGRPKGLTKPKLSLKPVANKLEELLKCKITFIDNWFRDDFDLDAELSKLPKKSIILLENVRFYLEEELKGVDKDGNKVKLKETDESVVKFRKLLTSICDIYVNDAFGTCHRGHSSMVGVNVDIKAAGLLVKKELEYFNKALAAPNKPYLAILGGAKVSDKILVIESLLDKVNEMIIAGGMCFTFLSVLNNMKIGKSLFDEEGSKIVNKLIEKAKKNNVNIILPKDFVCADKFENEAKVCCNATLKDGIPDECMGLDIGPESIKEMTETIKKAKTVVFNGPPGVFEFENFSNGTKQFLGAIAEATKNGAVTIVGGGDSASSTNKFGFGDKVSHISTGGGASLELLEGKILPGVKNLTDI